ncbi:MAG: cysteine desulfurase family protein [Candidatus Limnocylindrales bacterium]
MAIYLDHAATTPLRAEALEAMMPHLTEQFGNPSSPHGPGRRARAALDEAHERVADALGADAREIVFTSGGTEAINLALKGAAWAAKPYGHHLVTTAVEHQATLNAVHLLEKFGFEVTELPVDRYGRVDPDDLASAITDRTTVVSLALANNEVGTLQPLAGVIERVRHHRRILIHVDAVQAAGQLALDLSALDVDLLSLAAHKFEGPKGIGALFVRRGTTLMAQLQGGSQERYRRAGTENVAGAVGMAVALQRAVAERTETTRRLRRLREHLRDGLSAERGVEVTGHPVERLPGLLSIVVRDADGAALQMALDLEGLACSTGSACTTGSTEPSHVLTAMGYPEDEARGALRLSLGRTTTEAEIVAATALVRGAIERHRAGVAALAEPSGLEVGA